MTRRRQREALRTPLTSAAIAAALITFPWIADLAFVP